MGQQQQQQQRQQQQQQQQQQHTHTHKHKASKKSDSETELHATEEELKSTKEQLAAAVAYYEKLKPTCVDSGITYEERVKRREEEMQSLKEALKILSGTDVDVA